MGKRGQKQCTHCEGYTEPRSISCPHCGAEFEKRVKAPRDPNKPDGRGRKICPDCSQPVGVRTKICPSCNFAFTIKKNNDPIRGQILNWQELTTGTRIRVIGGSGPYYEREDGERNYLSSRGNYVVKSVSSKGLNVIGDLSSKSADAGAQFLYMGPKEKSDICDNLWRDSHKLVKV